MAARTRRSRLRAPLRNRQSTNPVLLKAVLEIVENQLRDNAPPQTRATLNRLLVEGHSPEASRRLVGAVVASAIHDVLQQQRPYDETAYIEALQRLPMLPGDDDTSG